MRYRSAGQLRMLIQWRAKQGNLTIERANTDIYRDIIFLAGRLVLPNSTYTIRLVHIANSRSSQAIERRFARESRRVEAKCSICEVLPPPVEVKSGYMGKIRRWRFDLIKRHPAISRFYLAIWKTESGVWSVEVTGDPDTRLTPTIEHSSTQKHSPMLTREAGASRHFASTRRLVLLVAALFAWPDMSSSAAAQVRLLSNPSPSFTSLARQQSGYQPCLQTTLTASQIPHTQCVRENSSNSSPSCVDWAHRSVTVS